MGTRNHQRERRGRRITRLRTERKKESKHPRHRIDRIQSHLVETTQKRVQLIEETMVVDPEERLVEDVMIDLPIVPLKIAIETINFGIETNDDLTDEELPGIVTRLPGTESSRGTTEEVQLPEIETTDRGTETTGPSSRGTTSHLPRETTDPRTRRRRGPGLILQSRTTRKKRKVSAKTLLPFSLRTTNEGFFLLYQRLLSCCSVLLFLNSNT